MRLKLRFFTLLIIFSFILISGQMIINPGAADPLSSDSIQTVGITGGVAWAYNEHKTRFRDSSLDISDDDINFDKSVTNTRTVEIDLPVIMGMEDVDFFYERFVMHSARDEENATWKRENGWGYQQTIGNKTGDLNRLFTTSTNAFFRYQWFIANLPVQKKHVTAWGPQAWRGLAGGGAAWKTSPHFDAGWIYDFYTTNVTIEEVATHTVPIMDWLRTEHGQTTAKEYLITYLYDQDGTLGDISDDLVVLKEKIIPSYQLIKVSTKRYPVTVTETSLRYSAIDASYNFTGTYEEEATGYEVLISDAKDYVFGWYGAESATLDVKQSGGFNVKGKLQWNLTRDIEFANGTQVAENMRPWWAKSSYMTLEGEWGHSFEEDGTISGKGTYQQIAQVIRTRASTNVTNQLLVWVNLIPSVMFGYYDKDNSGDYSLRLNGSVLESMDEIMAIGRTHGIRLNNSYSAINAVSGDSYWKLGDEILIDKQETKVKEFEKDIFRIIGADPDPTSGNFSQTQTDFSWTTPTVDNDGKVSFKWGIDYNSFPVMWHARNSTYEMKCIELTDFGYEYSLEVDPNVGEAVFSNTYITTGVTNDTLKSLLKDLSMAKYKHDLFLSAKRTEDGVDSTEASTTEATETTMDGESVIDQEFGGLKKEYTLSNGTTYDSKVTTVNVLAVSGTSGEENENVTQWSPFASWFGRRSAFGLLKWSADNSTEAGTDWNFRENIVVTAYPAWDGKGITHDPSSTTLYKATPSEETTSKKAELSIFPILIAIPIVAIITSRKKKQK